MKNEQFTAYVTRYALTKGILTVTASHGTASYMPPHIVYRMPTQHPYGPLCSAFAGDWYYTMPEAISRAEKMRHSEIQKLQKRLCELQNLVF